MIAPSPPPEAARPSRLERWRDFAANHRRWGIVALLFGFTVINALDRNALSVLAPTLKEKLGFGAVEYSYVVSAFLAAYSIGFACCGRVIEHFGVKLALAGALVFWSFAGMLHAVAAGWLTLAICRALLGFGESFNGPAALRALSEWTPPRERGLSIAVFNNGYVWGGMIAPPLVAFLTVQLGWQWSFLITGGVGLLLLPFWLKWYHSPEEHPKLTAQERDVIISARAAPTPTPAAADPGRGSMLELLKNPLCVAFFVAQLLTDPIAYFFSFWLPDYLQQSRGLTLAMLGLIGWLPFLGYDIGGPGGGALSDWLVRRGWKSVAARRALMLFAACLMLLANVAVRAPSLTVSISLLVVLFAAQSCWKANLLALIAESVPRRQVATLAGLSALGGSLGGILSTLLTGRAIATHGYVPIFTVISCLPLVAFGVLTLALRWTARRALSPPAAP